MIVIIDYGMGNIRSVAKAVAALGEKVLVTDLPKKVGKAKKIILPGVGHFGQAILELRKRGLIDVIKKKIREEKVPFLGICLGMQLLFNYSEEAPRMRGLSIIRGEVKKFNKKNLTTPHMGWNKVSINRKNDKYLFKSISENSFFYFAHSYYCVLENKEDTLATTYYGLKFASSVHRENIWAVQFHPEKSQKVGLRLLKNFIELC